FRQAEGVAEGGQPLGMIAGEAVGGGGVKGVGAQLAVRRAVAEQMVGDHQDGVGHRDDGLLVAAAADEGGGTGRRGRSRVLKTAPRALSTRAWRRTRLRTGCGRSGACPRSCCCPGTARPKPICSRLVVPDCLVQVNVGLVGTKLSIRTL